MIQKAEPQTRTRPGRLLLWFGLLSLLAVVVLVLTFPAVRQYRSVAWVEAQGGHVEFEETWLTSCLPDGVQGWLSDKGVLPAIESIIYVEFYATQVSDAGLFHLEGMTSLQALDLTQTKVSDAGLAHLRGMSSLDYLNLNGTQVTDAGLVHLKGMTSLQWIFLQETQVSDAGVTELQKALPRTTISR